MEHKKYLSDTVMLTNEVFEQYARSLREGIAKQYGMTVEQWDAAVTSGIVVHPLVSGSNLNLNTQL